MSERHTIDIEITPQNPVQYLACCGIFEIVARFDPSATSIWRVHSPSRFEIETRVTEAALLECLVATLTDKNRWYNDNDVVCFEICFVLGDEKRTLCFDCWYETLDQQRKIADKSAWKMYAGQQTVEGISEDMIRVGGNCVKKSQAVSLASLLSINYGMTGRFGFDPRSSRNALDSGYSANDLKLPIRTYPFAELLALIGIQHFFPPRTRQSAGIESSRGWIEKNLFQYGLWMIPLPVALARVAAACAAIDDDSRLTAMSSVRATRDKYSNLTIATLTTFRR